MLFLGVRLEFIECRPGQIGGRNVQGRIRGLQMRWLNSGGDEMTMTDRNLRIVGMKEWGAKDKQIAAYFGLSEGRVKHILTEMRRKS